MHIKIIIWIGEEANGSYLAYHFDSRRSTVTITDINGKIVLN